jgi:hypothetical protein
VLEILVCEAEAIIAYADSRSEIGGNIEQLSTR